MGLEILQKIQSELKAPKSQFNKFGGYNYRNCEDILEAVKPLCAKYGVSVTCTDEIVQIGERYYVKATATIFGDNLINMTATAYAREPESKKGMDESQITGAASSYARKYALNGLFAIDDTKDADTLNKGEEEKPKPKAEVKPELSPLQTEINMLTKKLARINGTTAGKEYKRGLAELKLTDTTDKSLEKLSKWLVVEIEAEESQKADPIDELEAALEGAQLGA